MRILPFTLYTIAAGVIPVAFPRHKAQPLYERKTIHPDEGKVFLQPKILSATGTVHETISCGPAHFLVRHGEQLRGTLFLFRTTRYCSSGDLPDEEVSGGVGAMVDGGMVIYGCMVEI